MSTTGALKEYLRWRLSCREGELILLDPYLLDKNTTQTTIDFLTTLDRPIRALTAKWDAEAAAYAEAAGVVVKRLPQGLRDLHDRVWLFGESGLLVGGSINMFVRPSDATEHPATTATELPPGDAAAWRERFESWWS